MRSQNTMDLVSHDSTPLNNLFFEPLYQALENSINQRSCPSLPDETWLMMCVRRVIDGQLSGRGFLESISDRLNILVDPQLLCETLKSPRRLALCEEVSRRLGQFVVSQCSEWDPFVDLKPLNDYDIYAGDGTYIEHACHDPAIDGTKYATSHFYGLNLRSHHLLHLTIGDKSNGKKKEHDMSALKRLHPDLLRQSAPRGRKVIWVWDRAGINIAQWMKWKMLHGIYFVSRAKENMDLTTRAEFQVEKSDINAGVESDRTVYVSNQAVRCVRYRCPLSGKYFDFLTTLSQSIPPGIIAALYMARWDIEKSFDEIKHRLQENKSWATSPTAKSMQGEAICLTHNLLLLLERHLKKQQGVFNEQEDRRRQARIDRAVKKARQYRRISPSVLVLRLKARVTLRVVKFIRWVRNNLDLKVPWALLLASLQRRYATGRT